jgi:hypothetical protein
MHVPCSHGWGLTPVHVFSSRWSADATAVKPLQPPPGHVLFGHVGGLTPDMAPGAGC